MTFESQIWLILTPLLTLFSIGLVALGWRKRGHLLAQFAAARLLDRLTEKASTKRRILKSVLIVAAVTALGIALARPQLGVEWSERKARGLDIVFALDASRSMLANDLRPSRLERAKLAIFDLLERLESDRVGLVAFAGQAFLQTPPSLDYNAFRESLNATDPSIMSRGGSDLGRAIGEAAKAFPTETNVKVVILLTDGEDLGGQAIEAARAAAEKGIQIFAIGIGTPKGEYLRIRNEQGVEEFVRDNNGQPVRSQLDESTLRQIAQFTGGSYTRLSGNALDALYDSVLATLPREERESELQEIPIERFQWLLGAALIFLALEILIRNRRPRAAQVSALLCTLFLFSPNMSEANEAFNQAHAAIATGQFARANELYTEALQQTKNRNIQRDALYNMGHATYQIGRSAYDAGDPQTALKEVEAAEKLFESALEIDPRDDAIQDDLERTREVRKAIERLLDQEHKQDQENQPSGEDQEPNDESRQPEQNEGESSETGEQQEESQESEGQQNQEPNGQSDDSAQQDSSTESSGQGDEEQEPQQDPESATTSEAGGSEAQSEPSGAGEERRDEAPQEDSTGADEDSGDERESQQPVPEVSEKEGDANEGSGQPAGGIEVQGMTLQEAQDLLDSLQRKEEILPFSQPVPGRGQPLKDW